MINIEEIMSCLPHRYPMLLVDRILELEPGKSCTGLKNVTINEPFFQGHYPGMPIMPGVLIVEAMAQAGAIVILSDTKNEGLVPLIAKIGNVKFAKPVFPGDQLITKAVLKWYRSNVGEMSAEATVNGEAVASMDLHFKMISKDR